MGDWTWEEVERSFQAAEWALTQVTLQLFNLESEGSSENREFYEAAREVRVLREQIPKIMDRCYRRRNFEETNPPDQPITGVTYKKLGDRDESNSVRNDNNRARDTQATR